MSILRDPNRPKVPDVVPMAVAYHQKPGNGAGGNLHAVLDDSNIRDDDVSFCLSVCRERGDADGAKLAEALLRMTKTQRGKVINIMWEAL